MVAECKQTMSSDGQPVPGARVSPLSRRATWRVYSLKPGSHAPRRPTTNILVPENVLSLGSSSPIYRTFHNLGHASDSFFENLSTLISNTCKYICRIEETNRGTLFYINMISTGIKDLYVDIRATQWFSNEKIIFVSPKTSAPLSPLS